MTGLALPTGDPVLGFDGHPFVTERTAVRGDVNVVALGSLRFQIASGLLFELHVLTHPPRLWPVRVRTRLILLPRIARITKLSFERLEFLRELPLSHISQQGKHCRDQRY